MVFIKNTYYDGGDKVSAQGATSTTLFDGSVADRFTHLLRLAFEKITNVFLDMTLWIRNIKTDKVQTKELCIEEVCVTKEQLQQMLMQNNSNNNNSNNANIIPENLTSTPATSTSEQGPLLGPPSVPSVFPGPSGEEASASPTEPTTEVTPAENSAPVEPIVENQNSEPEPVIN